VRTRLYDIILAATEIGEFVEDDQSYGSDVITMKSSRLVRGNQIDLMDNLRFSQHTRSQQILRDARLIQTVLSASNEVSQMISNIQIQRFIALLTVVSLGIALLALLVSVQAGP
jgi:hypothetical protein